MPVRLSAVTRRPSADSGAGGTCQEGLLAAFQTGLIGSSRSRLGLTQVLMVVFQLAVLSWWVPQGRPLWMVFWILTVSHVASFFGWRLASLISLLLAVLMGGTIAVRPADTDSDVFALGLFSCAQAFAVPTHDWIHGIAWRREVQARTLTELMPVGVFHSTHFYRTTD